MTIDRRKFLGLAACSTLLPLVPDSPVAGVEDSKGLPGVGFFKEIRPDRWDPWIEVIPEAMHANVHQLSVLANQRPVLAVVKNSGYGIGTVLAAKILENRSEVVGFAAVKTREVLELSDAGIRKPIVLLARTTPADEVELLRRGVQLSIYDDEAPRRLSRAAEKLGRPANVHLYFDTGMSRMGVRHDKALPWLKEISKTTNLEVLSSFMGFTEEPEFDRVQLSRLQRLAVRAKAEGCTMGLLHAASSNAIYHFPESSLDWVRPGIALYGAYPTYPEKEHSIGPLQLAFRLRARVARVEQIKPGDTVSYGRKYRAMEPTWIATIPVGHSDGYPRKAVDGVRILIGSKTYPVIGAVSASHTIVELGRETEVRAGDIATLMGPDHPDIHPSAISTQAGVSVYDLLMHLSATLPRTAGLAVSGKHLGL